LAIGDPHRQWLFLPLPRRESVIAFKVKGADAPLDTRSHRSSATSCLQNFGDRADINSIPVNAPCVDGNACVKVISMSPDLTNLFNSDDSGWEFAPTEICQHEKLWPNTLAYHESSTTLVLIVKRSTTGEDFALSVAGLQFLLDALKKGERKDGKVVKAAFVVLADVDRQAVSQRLKVIHYSTAQQTRDELHGIEPNPGRLGPYWWLRAPVASGDFSNETW
jgi:hypothetical protein